MAATYFFYDLETSGLDARNDRIMQFAGQRTNMELEPVGEPINVLVRLNDDTLPSPAAIVVTGITPQQTVQEGYSEAEFARMLNTEVMVPDTIMVGFNNIRFDDEFVRHLNWRNFYDPYEWSYKEGRSRWDMLDVVRMTRALRPEGIKWPVVDGKPVNKLELISKENGLNHAKAHDALSDVEALIAVARLIKQKQGQLYDYLFSVRDKNKVKALVNLDSKRPFVYASGRYTSEFNHATVAFPLTSGKNGNIVVYDLRHDPSDFINLTSDELKQRLYASREQRKADDFVPVPVKELQYNRTPAVAPVGVLEQGDGWKKIGLSAEIIQKHMSILLGAPGFAESVRSVVEGRPEFQKSVDPEAQLYDGFMSDRDRLRAEAVRNADQNKLADFHPEFTDERLPGLLLHYKARNYPKALSESEISTWEKWRSQHLQAQLPYFAKELQKLAASTSDDNTHFLLQELQLWAESIVEPADQ